MLTLENITKSFNNQTVLNDLNLAFNEGETTVILGPSGSGKSTLLRLIDLLEIPDSGNIVIDGNTLSFPAKLGFKEMREHRQFFSMVFQNFNLFPHMTVLENVMEGPVQVKKAPKAAAKTQAQELLKTVGLSEKAQAYPKELSGGQMQRVAIARALAMDPEYLLYDEPTSALDPELAQEVLQVIQKLAKSGRSQIVVTHHMEFAQKVADRIIFVENGTIFFDGTNAEFFASQEPRIQKFVNRFV
jgi:cystine transport system ATP-binding protein